MGKVNGPYRADFPVGTKVKIVDLLQLEEFKSTWRYHDKLEAYQLRFAGVHTEVLRIGYYHGGDELYVLLDVPGIWHEQCLSAISRDLIEPTTLTNAT